MGATRTVMKLLEDKPGGGRKVRRPRLRWLDGVILSLRWHVNYHIAYQVQDFAEKGKLCTR
jgi:hypothetical protein